MKKVNFFVISKYIIPIVLEGGNISPLREKNYIDIINQMNDYIKDINISVDDIISIDEKERYYNIFYKYEYEEEPVDEATD